MPSRRDQIEMTPDERRSYLQTQTRLILVSNGVNGYPHPMPMSYCLDDQDRVVVTTFRKSQKVKNFERDPKASLLVESGARYDELKSVLAYAEADIVDDPALVLDTMAALAMKERPDHPDLERVKSQGRATAEKRLVIRFAPHTYITWDHSKLGGRY